MEYSRLLRPLPLILIFLFVAVAVADLVQKLTEEPPPPPEIAGAAIPRFVAMEPVIDFRADGGDPVIEFLPIPELVQGQWSDASLRVSGRGEPLPISGSSSRPAVIAR